MQTQKMSKRLGVIGGLAVASALLAACGAAPNAQQDLSKAAKVTVATGSVENRIVATGKVVARADVNVAFQRGGIVTEVLVREGQLVKAGDRLAVLDTTDLELTVQQQYASFLNAQATYSQTIKGPTAAEVKAAQASISSANAQIASASAAKKNLYAQPTEAELLQARADLQNAEVEVKQAQANYDRRNRQDPASISASQEAVSLEKATNNYNRAKAAYDAKFEQPSAAEVASANSQISSANAQIQSAKKSLEALQPVSETIKQREAQMQQAWLSYQAALNNLKNAAITAPFDGLVTSVSYNAGDYAGAGQPAISIADFAVPVFEVDVDEADLGGIKVGQLARVRLQTYPNTPITAKVEAISTVGTNSGAVVNYKVKLSLANADGATDQPTVLINMSGTGEIVTAKTDDAIVVPNDVITVDSQTKLYSVQRMKADGTAEKVTVKLGYRDASQTQILEGVGVGDQLVVPQRGVTTSGPGGGPPAPGS
jgi:multidrug efflux pump subunit AcrA (membrane-fusion protein)